MPAGRMAIAAGARALRRAGLSTPRRDVGVAARLRRPRAPALPGEGAEGGGVGGAAASQRSLVPERGRHFEWWRRGRWRGQESGRRWRGAPWRGLRLGGRRLGGSIEAERWQWGAVGSRAGDGGTAPGRRGKWRRGASGGSGPRVGGTGADGGSLADAARRTGGALWGRCRYTHRHPPAITASPTSPSGSRCAGPALRPGRSRPAAPQGDPEGPRPW